MDRRVKSPEGAVRETEIGQEIAERSPLAPAILDGAHSFVGCVAVFQVLEMGTYRFPDVETLVRPVRRDSASQLVQHSCAWQSRGPRNRPTRLDSSDHDPEFIEYRRQGYAGLRIIPGVFRPAKSVASVDI